MAQAHTLDRIWARGRSSLRHRWQRLLSKLWQVLQCAVAAGLAWLIASDLLDHPQPFFAPIAAVISLGTSYGQRLRRVVEVTVGVAIGVFISDLLILLMGSGWWQMAVIVAISMSIAVLMDTGTLFINQAAVQAIVIVALAADTDQAFTRWLDALVGGGIALLLATLVPAAALRRPREQASRVLRKESALMRAAADVMRSGEMDVALDLLADARQTDNLIRELQAAASEGVSVVASSPFRRGHRPHVRRMVEVVEPLDRSLRSTRVLVRRTAVASYYRRSIPRSYPRLLEDLADATDLLADELAAERTGEEAREAIIAVGMGTAEVERTDDLSTEVVLAQIRSVVTDLLCVTGMGILESTDQLPSMRR